MPCTAFTEPHMHICIRLPELFMNIQTFENTLQAENAALFLRNRFEASEKAA